ncbi:MAG: hypothetical protein ACK5LS_03640 [Propioniciclava sp.]
MRRRWCGLVIALATALVAPLGAAGDVNAARAAAAAVAGPDAVDRASQSFWSSVLSGGQSLRSQPATVSDGVGPLQLTLAEALTTVAAEWRAAGADPSAITASIGDLPVGMLGEARGTHIVVDDDAAGWGWQRMDLATVLRHEMGHALGYGHTDGGLMGEVLSPGARWSVPAQPGALPRSHEAVQALVAPVLMALEVAADEPVRTPTGIPAGAAGPTRGPRPVDGRSLACGQRRGARPIRARAMSTELGASSRCFAATAEALDLTNDHSGPIL